MWVMFVPWGRSIEGAWFGPCELGARGEGPSLGGILGVQYFAIVVQAVT